MKLYHGSDNPDLKLQSVKSGKGYHPGAGPVEFLGPSFSESREVAASYGKYIYEFDFVPIKIKKYKSLNALKNDIIKIFGLPKSGQNIGDYYRDIADSYKAKLLAEGYDSIEFPEGLKLETNKNKVNTIVIFTLEE